MKFKKLLAVLLTVIVAAATMVACTAKDDNVSSTPSSSSSAPISSEEVSSEPTVLEGGVKKVRDDLAELLGEDYMPSMEFDQTYLEEQMGITADMVKEFFAEGAMISTQVDTFVGIEAVDEEKAKEVEKKLTEYRQKLIDDTMQYPSNAPKIQQSTVSRYDNYVFFTILGAFPDNNEADEEELLKFYEEQSEKVNGQIKKTLGK